MERVSTGTRVFKCANGEDVTITFASHNTDIRITYRFDHQQEAHIVEGNSLTFTVNQDLMILRIFFHFINESGTGGSYDITLSGSAGGVFPDPPPVKQSGDFVPIRRYAFTI